MNPLREKLIEAFASNATMFVVDTALEAFQAFMAEGREDWSEMWAQIEDWHQDDNTFWRAESGDHQNAIDLLYERVRYLESLGCGEPCPLLEISGVPD